MKISVIIPTYKPQSYLWECLDSLVKQTFSKEDFEIIIVLNGCCEPYNSNIENYIAIYMTGMNVNFIQIAQGGVSNARNIALDIAKGEYVTFIDDDDFVSPDYLKELYEKASYDTISLCYPYLFNDGNMQQKTYNITTVYDLYVKKKNINISSQVRKYFSGPCMKLIPKDFIEKRRFDVRFKNGEDTLFMFLISDRISKIAFTSSKAIYYRRNRIGSAVNLRRSSCEIVKSNINQIITYWKYYLSNPFKYNFSFFLSRIGGALWAILSLLKRSR